MVVAERMGKPVKVPPLESVVPPADSVARLLPTAAQDARQHLGIVTQVQETYQQTGFVGRTGRPARGQFLWYNCRALWHRSGLPGSLW